jgi:hypothetical protein
MSPGHRPPFRPGSVSSRVAPAAIRRDRGRDLPPEWSDGASSDEIDEYRRFGPWIAAVDSEAEMPRRFRQWYPELAKAAFLLKVPREVERAAVRPGMDLYRSVLAVFADRICLVQLSGGGVSRSDLAMEQVVATRTYSNLLRGRWSLLAADGTSFDIDYNNVGQRRIAEVDLFVRRHRRGSSQRPSPIPVRQVSDYFFVSALAALTARAVEPQQLIHAEAGGRPCRDDQGRRRRTTGLMVVEAASELILVNRGEPTRPRFRALRYASVVMAIPYQAMTSFSVLTPPADSPARFHRLVIRCGRQAIDQACLTAPDAVVAALAAHGVPEVEGRRG